MARKLWTPEELWWLVQAWEEAMNAAKRVGGKKRKMSTSEFHKLIHERFVELAGGSSPRTVATIVIRKDVLQNSYEFIRSFLGNKETSGGLDWFALTTSDQRELMKTAGGKRVQPIEERVFTALEKVLKDESASTEQSDESEGEDSGNEGYSSEGDKFEKGMRQKKEVPPPKKVDKRHLSRSSGGKASKSALEEESGELLSQKEEGHAKKKRHKPSTPKVGMKDILERQSGVLAGFLEKRADERSQEHERSRQEREADQKFWAAETAKDRALLRELFTSK